MDFYFLIASIKIIHQDRIFIFPIFLDSCTNFWKFDVISEGRLYLWDVQICPDECQDPIVFFQKPLC